MTLPDPAHAKLVTRVDVGGPNTRQWTGNDDDAGHHHGLISANEVPCFVALSWHSKRHGRTVHVGTFKLNLRRLAKDGYAVERPGNQVRLRFVRDPEGLIAIQVNDSSPSLPVGRADF